MQVAWWHCLGISSRGACCWLVQTIYFCYLATTTWCSLPEWPAEGGADAVRSWRKSWTQNNERCHQFRKRVCKLTLKKAQVDLWNRIWRGGGGDGVVGVIYSKAVIFLHFMQKKVSGRHCHWIFSKGHRVCESHWPQIFVFPLLSSVTDAHTKKHL